MSELELALPTLPLGTADAVLNALPHPVIMVARRRQDRRRQCRRRRAFFEASVPLLRRQLLRDLVPFGSPLLALVEQVRDARRRGQRIQGRSRRRRAIPASGWSTCTSRRCRSGPTTWW